MRVPSSAILATHGLSLGSLAALALMWYGITETTDLVNPLFLPSPISVAQSVASLAERGLAGDITATVLRVMVAFVASVLVGLPLALALSESRLMQRLLTPYIDFVRYIPVPVLIPLTILFFGIGEGAKIALLFIGTFFQIALLFESDLAKVPREYFDLAYSLNFTARERIIMKFQSALPAMMDNARISLGLCWSYVVIAELVASETGLGHMIKEAQRFSLTADVYVGILLMGIIGFVSDYAFRKSSRLFFPYLT